MRERELTVRWRNLEERTAVDVERFDQAPLRIFDGAIYDRRIEIDESGGEIGDECLEGNAAFNRRAQFGICPFTRERARDDRRDDPKPIEHIRRPLSFVAHRVECQRANRPLGDQQRNRHA